MMFFFILLFPTKAIFPFYSVSLQEIFGTNFRHWTSLQLLSESIVASQPTAYFWSLSQSTQTVGLLGSFAAVHTPGLVHVIVPPFNSPFKGAR